MTTTINARSIADATFETAYSATRYGVIEWRKAAEYLAGLGLNADEIEWVLRSKWMRWAADEGEADYGHATADMLAAYMVRDGGLLARVSDVRAEVALELTR